MSIRWIIFFLFLYIALAWVIVAFFYTPEGVEVVVRKGLLWTALGLGAVLLWPVAQQVWGWWRLRSARAQAKPARQEPAVPRTNEEDGTLAGLIAEADNKLARAADGRPRRVRDLPVYLLIGPEGAGKTSLLHNAGVDARLLAGQVSGGGGPVTGTRVANIWLANEFIFIEVAGRLFQGDAGRLGEFLSVLRPWNEAAGWRALWSPKVKTLEFRGAILCWDLRGFVAAHDRASLERSTNTVRERLLKISEVFGVRCPVYAVFTRADAIPFFSEFFDRIPEAEASQPLGALADPADATKSVDDEVWAEAENKRLSRDFNSVFLCLSARRLPTLSQEPLPARKPAIYEFPREFKRLRGPVVQFLVDSLRPDPLGLSPALRGFFFCGSRQVEAAPGAPLETQAGGIKADRGSVEATRIFRPEATQIFNSPQSEPHHGMLVEKPVFTRDLFQSVLRNDRPAMAAPAGPDAKLNRKRLILVGAAAAVAALITLTWTVSWAKNRGLVNDAKSSLEASGNKIQDMSLESLRGLDNLRRLLVTRLDQPRELSMSWGLYTGNQLRTAVRDAYFSRLNQLVLRDANAYLADDLRRSDPAGNAERYDRTYGHLKTHIIIAQSGCPVDAPLVRETLSRAVGELRRDLDEPRKELVDRQIEYYAATLEHGNPVRLAPDPDAISHARTSLMNSRGPQQVYAAIVAEIRKGASRVLVSDHVSDYKQVLASPDDVSFEFTKEGREKFEKLADSGKFNLSGESCVLGESKLQEKAASLDQIRQAKSIYYQRYKDAWTNFLGQTNVRGYRDTADAVAKLNLLSGPSSPLLGLVKFVGDNTWFPAQKPAAEEDALDKTLNRFGLGKAKKQAEKAADKLESLQKPAYGPADLNRVFQPVQLAVQPDAKNLVTEKNKSYVDSLRKLQESLDRYRNASTAERLPLIAQVQEAFSQAGGAQRGLADGFNRDTEGVDQRLAEILLQPIRNAKGLIPTNPEKAAAGERNAQLAQMCAAAGPVLRKYPFNRLSGAAELSVADLAHVFAPGSGAVWKYEAQSLGELLVKNGSRWEQKPDVPKPQVSAELLEFLNRAQAITEGFFAGGGQQVGLQYKLRPVTPQAVGLKLQIDGTTMNSKASALQQTFRWPADNGADGATGNALVGDNEFGFGKYPGVWGVFKLFQYADDRALGEKIVTWSRSSGINAQPQPLPPVKVEFVQFPGGVDLFNPRFFVPLKCPGQAIAPQ